MTYRRGVHGERISLLAQGTMRMPDGKGFGGYDTETVRRYLDALYRGGVNYFDCAPVYCRGKNEEIVGRILADYSRDSYFIATKLSNFAASTWPRDASRRIYDRSQELLGRGRIDFYLLHSLGRDGMLKSRFLDNGMLDFCLAERAAGRIRNLGFSFHGSKRCFEELMALHPTVRWDFVQLQLNVLDWRHAAAIGSRCPDAAWMYGECARRSIPVMVMEPLLGGRLARFSYAAMRHLAPLDPRASMASWALRFAGTPKGVATVISGMNAMAHIEENLRIFDGFRPLSERELAAADRVAEELVADRTIPCNRCDYCMPCPYGLDIPSILSCWNAAVSEKRVPDDPGAPGYGDARRRFLAEWEAALPDRLRRADRCTGCGRCLPHCPQAIDLPKEIARIARRVDAIIERKAFAW